MKRDEQERFDLSALDPFADTSHADGFVRGVLDRSALELARRRRRGAVELPWSGVSVFNVVAGWARPALAAAVFAAAVSVLALRLGQAQEEASSGVVEALAVPSPVMDWLVDERAPATADLILSLERGSSW